MTLIMLTAVILGRPALTMRNLALAALTVIIFEPEAILGASFQLSFAAVAALVAVYEARTAKRMKGYQTGSTAQMWQPQRSSMRFDPITRLHKLGHWFKEAGLATICATGATASFMAYDFHEFSPYVLIGNPLTMLLIEFFAVPGALLGTLLYPLGLDGFVWMYLGVGIDAVLMMAHWLAALPGATIHLKAFASWSIVYLSLGVLCMVIWRSWAMRLMAIPFFAIGIAGATMGKAYDVLIPPTPDAIAIRGADGKLGILGKKANRFAAEQWLRADGDGRSTAKTAPPLSVGECDKLGCVGTLHDGRKVALIYDRAALAVDCQRANIIITTEYAPKHCGAELVVDRKNLEVAGAVGLRLTNERVVIDTARSPTEDRPWSPFNIKAKTNWPELKQADSGEPKEEYNPFTDQGEAPVLLD
jgi:competence protein ComEC